MNALATARKDRVFGAMAAEEIDVLVLGRQDNTNYASGMARLWTAGTRPFGAGCILVGSTGRVHVLSGWDVARPDHMTRDDLYPSTWNPRIMGQHMNEIPGLAEAARIGVDEISPSFARAAARFAPEAEVVPADLLMAAVRRTKLPDEIVAIEHACHIAAEAAREATQDSGAIHRALARHGATIPAGPIRVTADGVDVGVLLDFYEGGACIGGDRGDGRLVAACRVGAGHADLAAAAESTDWLVRGLGMGFERPVIDTEHGRSEVLTEDMVLSVRDGDRRDVVAITAAGSRILSTEEHGP